MTEQFATNTSALQKPRSTKLRLFALILVIGVVLYNREYLEFSLYYKYTCLSSAMDVGNGQKLGVCHRQVYDNGRSMPKETAIIYDSGDQLLLPDNKRSLEWLAAAEKIGIRQMGIKESWLKTNAHPIPVLLDMFDDVIPWGQHFYHVNM